jgi:hypothetical protein
VAGITWLPTVKDPELAVALLRYAAVNFQQLFQHSPGKTDDPRLHGKR